ncbi:MAG TPA: hypothetical protein VNX27_07185 [Chthoniobacterales bacterium]|jgi:hypothetical protein|nr:hypothetical protein [Chthoniobacterales bacterium]
MRQPSGFSAVTAAGGHPMARIATLPLFRQGIGVALKPRVFAYIVAIWLVLIILNLLSIPGYYDVALRDLRLALCALALGRLSQAA